MFSRKKVSNALLQTLAATIDPSLLLQTMAAKPIMCPRTERPQKPLSEFADTIGREEFYFVASWSNL
jgi:hypothetical protein